MDIFKVFKDTLTGIDGETYDIVRVGVFTTIVIMCANAITAMINQTPMDYLAFGSGCAAIFAAGGFGIGQKAKTEPEAK